jgi:hypothetical protein
MGVGAVACGGGAPPAREPPSLPGASVRSLLDVGAPSVAAAAAPPMEMSTGPAAPSATLRERVVRDQVSIAPGKVADYLRAGDVTLIAAPDAGVRAVWQDERDIHIRSYDANLAPAGDALVLEGHVLAGVERAADGGFFLAAFPYRDDALSYLAPLALDLWRVAPDGAVVWRVPLVGHAGDGAGREWFQYSSYAAAIATVGEQVGVYLAIARDWGDPGHPNVHQGDWFVALRLVDGQPIDGTHQQWTSSHSYLHAAVVGSRGQFITMSLGDGYPIGVQAVDRSVAIDDEHRARVLWPPPEAGLTYDPAATGPYIGGVYGAAALGGRIFATIGSFPGGFTFDRLAPADPMLLTFDEQLGEVTTRWLAETPDLDEGFPYLAPQHDGLLAIWGAAARSDGSFDERPSQATLLALDASGAPVEGPVAIDELITAGARPAQLSDGTVAWATATYGGSEVRFVRVRP